MERGPLGPGCEFRVFFDETRAKVGGETLGAPPQACSPTPTSGLIRYKKLEKVTDVRYGYPLLPPNGSPIESMTPRSDKTEPFQISFFVFTILHI